MNEKVRAKALATLDGMEQIARNDRMKKVGYVSQEVDEERAGAICGGHKACLLGSAWIAYGITAEPDPDGWEENSVRLPGVEEYERDEFLRTRPALRAVYNALNETALKRRKWDPDQSSWMSPAEAYFEDRRRSLPRATLLRFIADTRQQIEAA